MDAIRLEQLRAVPETFHQEGHRRRLVAFRELRERRRELLAVFEAVVRRDAHADQQHPRAGLPRALDDGRQVFAHLGERQAAQAVGAAQLEDDAVGLILLQDLVDARQPAGGRLAGDALIDNDIIGLLALYR